VHIGEHCLIVALGIAADGQKHVLGLWDGSTENARVCQDLLANLHSRGLRTDRSLLVILDRSKALRNAVRATFGAAALVQRCQVHKTRNILEYLPSTVSARRTSRPAPVRPPAGGDSGRSLDSAGGRDSC
jgi:putative transposase